MDDLMASVEEAFFERYFSYESDPETIIQNLESSLKVFFQANKECLTYAEKISDGEVVDTPSVVLSLQNLIFSHRYEEKFKKELGGEGPIMDITSINMTGKSADILAEEGSALVAASKKTHNFSDMEKGNFLLFTAMNA